jgi:hypothetical protein
VEPHPEELWRVENNLTHHAPFGDQAERYERLRSIAKEYAKEMLRLCPSSRERSVAMTKLEEVVFWANASIARNEKRPDV